MRTIYFNELSIHNQFEQEDQFKSFIRTLTNLSNFCANGGSFFIHRSINDRCVFDKPFRSYCSSVDRSTKMLAMRLLDKHPNYLPDQQYHTVDTLYKLDDKDVSNTSIAEVSYLNECGAVEASLFSYTPSNFNSSRLNVINMANNASVDVNNHTCYHALVDSCFVPFKNWDYLLKRLQYLPFIKVESYVIDRLKTETFTQSLASNIYEKVITMSKIVGAKNLDEYHELRQDYCHGSKAWITDSMDKSKEKMMFCVDGKQCFCGMHAKIKSPQFRIHFYGNLEYKSDIVVVYIGPKITK